MQCEGLWTWNILAMYCGHSMVQWDDWIHVKHFTHTRRSLVNHWIVSQHFALLMMLWSAWNQVKILAAIGSNREFTIQYRVHVVPSTYCRTEDCYHYGIPMKIGDSFSSIFIFRDNFLSYAPKPFNFNGWIFSFEKYNSFFDYLHMWFYIRSVSFSLLTPHKANSVFFFRVSVGFAFVRKQKKSI